MPKLAFVLTLLCTAMAATLAFAQHETVSLRDEPGWLPYEFRLTFLGDSTAEWDVGWGASRPFADFDGDGFHDYLKANEYGVVFSYARDYADSVAWQTNFPADFADDGPCGTVDGVWDLDADGRLEVVSTASTADGMRWLIRSLDLETGEIVREFEMAGGVDRYADGKWDGQYRSFGVLDVPSEDGTKRGLVVAFMAGFDQLPRGVRVLDVATGDALWEFLAGPKIMSHNVEVVDLDGDGPMEVVFLGVGVNNLGGRKINGTTDDHAMVFVLEADGSLRWSQTLGAAPAGGYVTTFDTDADGTREVFVTGFVPELREEGFAVFDHFGRTRAAVATGGGCTALRVMSAGETSASVFVSLGSRIRRYQLAADELTLLREAEFGSGVTIAILDDVIEGGEPELLVRSQVDDFWLLDLDLEPLAYDRNDKLLFRSDNTYVIDNPEGHRELVTMGGLGRSKAYIRMGKVARPIPWAAIAMVGGIGGGALLAWRRRTRPRSRRAIRELRLQLLARLQLSGHGAIGALSSVRRIIWHLETVRQGFEVDERVTRLFRDLSEDTLHTGLPALQDAVELAELASIDGDAVRGAKKAVDRLEVVLKGLAGAGYELDSMLSVADDLRSAAAAADAQFRVLRGLVEGDFHADPTLILERSLAAHRESIERHEVKVTLEMEDAPGCQIDPEEMAFVLDNLVENAVRAMRGSPQRVLAFSWEEAGDHVILQVSDTGCGIPPDELDLVMKPGHSSRKGGGLGLPRSKEILVRYGGSISVKESSPGRGTTMALLIPIARTRTEN